MTAPVPEIDPLVNYDRDFATYLTVQYFSGYDECLLTYHQRTATVGDRIFTGAFSINSDRETKDKQATPLIYRCAFADFLSVGGTDLLQYLVADDRISGEIDYT